MLNCRMTSSPLDLDFLFGTDNPDFIEFIMLCFAKTIAGNNPVKVPIIKVRVNADRTINPSLKIPLKNCRSFRVHDAICR